jgi:hypothetical protein
MPGREGRHVFYEIDATAVAERLEEILAITRLLEAAMSGCYQSEDHVSGNVCDARDPELVTDA